MKIRLIIIVALILIGIFMHPIQTGVIDFLIRLIIFTGIGYLLYDLLHKNKKGKKPGTDTENDTSTSAESSKILPKELTDQELGIWQFIDLIKGDEKIIEIIYNHFGIIADIVIPDNGWLLYKGKNVDYEVIYFKNFKNEEIEIDEDCLNTGLMQLLAGRDNILIENSIKNTLNAMPCYDNSEYTPGAFVGIPVLLNNDERLIFTYDAAGEQHFNSDDKLLLERICNNLVFILHSRIKNVKFLLELKTVEKQIDFSKSINATRNLNAAIDIFIKKIWQEIETDRITFSMVSPKSEKAVIKKVLGLEDEFGENHEFTLEEGLTGWVISKNKPYLIDDMSKGEYFIPRYSKTEKSNYGFRSFLGLPLGTNDRVIGALTIENKEAQKYNDSDKELILNYVDIFNTILKRFAN